MKIAILATLLALSQAAPASTEVSSSSSNALSQFRFAFDGGLGVTVSWSSTEQVEDPIVWFSSDGWIWLPSLPGTSTTFPTATVWDNHVSIPLLLPYTKYYYKVSGQPSDFDPVASDYYFTTARLAGSHDEFSIAMYGDLGYNVFNGSYSHIPDSFNSLLAAKDTFDFIVHNGDLGYADTWQTEESDNIIPPSTSEVDAYNEIMNLYYDQSTNITKNTPYMVGPGKYVSVTVEYLFNVSNQP
jgi:hypothetical protein